MRLLVQIIVLTLLVMLGWHQPFRDHVVSVFPSLGIAPSRIATLATPPPAEQSPHTPAPRATAAPVAPTPPPKADWLWQEKPMDRAKPAKGGVRDR